METDTTTETDAPEAPVEDFDADRAKAKITKANSEAAALRKRLKEAEEKAARLDEIENASKSEAERFAERIAAAERAAADAEQRALRVEVAAAAGLTPAQAKRLVGSTREELEADAADLLATFTPPDPQTPPKVDLGQGTRSGMSGQPLDSDPLLNDLKSKLGIA